MKARRCRKGMLVSAVLLAMLGVLLTAGEQPDAMHDGNVGLELLVNGDFEGSVTATGPAGWFKAVSPEGVETMRVEVQQVPYRGNVAFMDLTGPAIKSANNWAQRVPTVPIGATVRVTADVKTQNVPANAGFVMVQCWDGAQRLISGASSQSVGPIGGTEDWRQVSFEFVVPSGTETMILRCGLAGPGRIWFDNLSMKMIAAGVPDAARGPRSRGFEVTAESLGQLERVTAFSDGLAAYAQRELGADVRIHREVFAQGNGKFQVVLSLDLSKAE